MHIVSRMYPLHNGSFVLAFLLQVQIYSWSGGCGGGRGGGDMAHQTSYTASQQSQITNATDSDIERVSGPSFT